MRAVLQNGRFAFAIKRESIECCFWSFYCFLVVFSPPFLPYMNAIVAIISFCVVLFNYRKIGQYVITKSKMLYWIFSLFITFCLVFCVSLPISIIFFNDTVSIGHYQSIINRYGLLVLVVFSCGTLLLSWMHKRNRDIYFLLRILIYAGVIEGCCSICALLFPSVKSFFIQQMDFSNSSRDAWFVAVRAYGFANTLVDTFGYGIAILSGISFYYGIIRKQFIFIIYSCITAISALLNARTGVVILCGGIFLLLLFILYKKRSKFFRICFSLLTIIFSCTILFIFLKINYPSTAEWIEDGLSGLINMVIEQDIASGSSGLQTLFSEQFWNVPADVRIFFGTGHSLFLADGYLQSDVGYINEIWIYGLIGIAVSFGFILYLGISCYRNTKDVLLQVIVLYLVAAFFVFNIKASAYGGNPGAISTLMILFGIKFYSNMLKTETTN